MAKITLNDVTGGYFAPTTINSNNDILEAAFDNTLSRDGSSPNAMEANLDMNSNRIINLASPVNANDALRYVDLSSAVTIAIAPSQSGNSGKFLTTDGSNASWGDEHLDSLFRLKDDGDTTKKVAFQLSGLTTATTRTKTLQDISGTLYESGGTDIPVADGGTGVSTHTSGGLLTGNAAAAITTLNAAAKGDIVVASAAGTWTKKTVGTTDGQTLIVDSSQATGLSYIDNPARSNLLVNPDFLIDQNNAGALYTVNTTDVRTVDGWSGSAVGAGVFKIRQLTDPDNAALMCMEITCTTADASIAATDDYFIYTAVEGFDATSLQSGTANAQQVTLKFKFKSNVTGVYGVFLANSAKNRSNYQIITVADTNEHEYTLTWTLDTTGTWLYTNGVGLYLGICLAAGSNFQGTAGAWAADAKQTTSAQCNFMSVNTNTAYLKRVQFIQSSIAQAYRVPDYQVQLSKCQRYWQKISTNFVGYGSGGGTISITFPHPVKMRASPTATNTVAPSYSNASGYSIGSDGTIYAESISVTGLGQCSWSTAVSTFNARIS